MSDRHDTTTDVERQAYRWALHSPEFYCTESEGNAIACSPAKLRAWKSNAVARYIAHENRFFSRKDVAMAVASVSGPTNLFVIELASLEHANAGAALMSTEKEAKKRTAEFYSNHVRLLLRDLLPRSQFAVAYCNQRRQDLSMVKSFRAWKDRAFYEKSVLTMLRLRAQLRIEPPIVRLSVSPLPLILNATIDASRNVTKTVCTERLADGKMRSTVTEE